MSVERSVPAILRFHRIYGHLIFLALLILSIVYAAERATYVDSAWQFFQRVNESRFDTPFGRYGVIPSQIPLWIAVKLHFPFRSLVYIFSSTYILLYFLIWRLCTFTFKNDIAGLTVMLCMIVGVRETFLHTVTESHQAIAYSALLYAMISYESWKTQWIKIACLILVSYLIMFSHPFGAFTAGFLLAYRIVHEKKRDRTTLALLSVILCIAMVRFIFPDNKYDAEQYAHLHNGGLLSTIAGSGVLNFIRIHSIHFYWIPEFMAFFSLVFLIARKRFMTAGLMILSVIVFLSLSIITYHDGDSSIMVERLFLPAFFMINLVFSGIVVTEGIKWKWPVMMVLLVISLNGLRYVNSGCLMYKKRLSYLDDLVQKTMERAPAKKAYIMEDDVEFNKEVMMVHWALASESIIWSTFQYGESATICVGKPDCADDQVQIMKEYPISYSGMNQQYFRFSPGIYVCIGE